MMMTRRRVSAAAVLLLCLGCGSSGGNNNPSLSVSPNAITVTAGGTAVSFTATLSNATGTVSWTLTGPGSLTPSTGTTTSYTPPAAVASATTATLTASAAGLTGNSTITINNNPSLSVSPNATTVIAGGTAVSFTATLSNATGTVSWTLTGPGSISPSNGTTTSYTPPAAVASATTATLTASAAGLTGSSTITINPLAAITVAGVVVDGSLRKFPGVSVFIGAQRTVTDANGHFSIANVTPPYDLTALATNTRPGGPPKAASLFKGLTRTDPEILVFLHPTSTENKGTLTGTVTGGDALGTVGETTVVSWGSTQTPPGFQFQTSQSLDINSSPYSLDVTWDAALSSITGNMHVLQWAQDNRLLPSSYKGYAVKTGVQVAAGGTTNDVNLAMSAPGTSSVGGSVTVPPGVTVTGKFAGLSFDDTAQIPLAHELSPGTSFSYLYPNITGATAVVFVSGEANADGALVQAQVSAIALGTTNVSIALPSPISLIMPADSATNIGTDVDFSWTAVSGGNVVYTFEVQGPSGWYAVFTTATSTRIPDLAAQGMGLPSATAYGWSVEAVGPYATVDSAAGPKSISPTGNTLVTSFARSRTFTTP